MTELVGTFGYLAVFAGTFLEGEAMLLAAGFAAQQGLLDLPLAIGVGGFGAALSDHCWFLMGRWKGSALRARVAAANDARISAVVHRHPAIAILLVRFLYGLRTAGAVMMGTFKMRVAKFSALNVLGAAIWATLVAGAGYSLGSVSESLLVVLRQLEGALLTTLVLAAGFYWLRRRSRASHTRATESPTLRTAKAIQRCR